MAQDEEWEARRRVIHGEDKKGSKVVKEPKPLTEKQEHERRAAVVHGEGGEGTTTADVEGE